MAGFFRRRSFSSKALGGQEIGVATQLCPGLAMGARIYIFEERPKATQNALTVGDG